MPNENIEQQYEDHCREQLQLTHQIFSEKRIDNAKKNMEKILAGKRKKAIKFGNDPNEITEDAILEEIQNRSHNDSTNVLVQIPTQEPFELGKCNCE